MSMNYVGSISIIDRGDAPAKAVIDKNTRSLAQRVADETKDELDKVMDRVDNIYVSYEMSTQTMFENPRGSPSVEYIEDIKELEEIIKDAVKKKKYQQQVTIFIVGFQDVCAQKMQLLQQVNQFFLENSRPEEEEVEEKMELDLEEASNKVNESLSTAEDLAKKLSDLNQDIIEWLVNYANTKASNKGKKRLEKSLEAAKNDMNSLAEKLLNLQTELEEKDEKVQQLGKQLEAKTQEAVRYKTAAEVAKKSAQDNESHTSTLQEEISRRDEKIQELRTKLSRMEISLSESQFDGELKMRKLDNTTSQTKVRITVSTDVKEKLAKLQEEVDTKKIAITEAEREMEKLHKEQMHELKKGHFEEVEELRREHREEISQLTAEVNSIHKRLAESERNAQQAFDESDELRAKLLEIQLQEVPKRKSPQNQPQQQQQQQQSQENVPSRGSSGKSIAELSTGDEEQRPESRPSTKDTKSSKKSDSKPVKSLAKSPSRGPQKPRGGKDFADASIQDEGGDSSKAYVEKSNDPSRQATRQSKTLEPVVETGDVDFTNSFDLDDEDSWASVPANQVIGRFSQYRGLTLSKVRELEEQLNITLTKTHRKVNSLKAQFNDHKTKWEAERKVLIEQVEQAQKLQTDAEKEADAAMTQLEEFINEQEKLEDEEEMKRQEVLKTMSRPGTTSRKQQPPSIVEQKPARASPEATEKPQAEEGEGEKTHSDASEQELNKLMQQTDDAKSRPGSTLTIEEDTELAPWLTSDFNQGTKKEKPKTPSETKTEPQTDLASSRLTSAADAELLKLMPPEDGTDTQMSSAEKIALAKPKSETRLPVDLLKGEKERLRSRTSSKASRPPRIIGSHFDEKDEEVFADEEQQSDANENDEDSEEEGSIELAPWMATSNKKVEKPPQSRQHSTRPSRIQDVEDSERGTAMASPNENRKQSSVRKSRQGSVRSKDVADTEETDDDKEDEEIADQKSGQVVSRSGLKSQKSSRQNTHLSLPESRPVMKEDDDDNEPEDSEPRKKVKRKHKKESDRTEVHSRQKTTETDLKSIDKEKNVNKVQQSKKDTDFKDQRTVKNETESKSEAVVKERKETESSDNHEPRADTSRMSITRQGKRKNDKKDGHVRIEDIDGEANETGETFSEMGEVTKVSELSLPMAADSDSDPESGEAEERQDKDVMESKDEPTDNIELATDEEKVKLMIENARSRSSKSNLSDGKREAPGSRQSDRESLNENKVKVMETPSISEQTSGEKEEKGGQISHHPHEKIEAESKQGDREGVQTPYTRQMSQHPRGQIEAETPYTRQTSQHPRGQIEAETPYTRQMSQHPRGQTEAETPYTRQTSQHPQGQIEAETPYTRQTSQHPRGQIDAETPYTRQTSQHPPGQIEAETPYTRQTSQHPQGQTEAETPYTRQTSQHPRGQTEAETPYTRQTSQHPRGQTEAETPYTRQTSQHPRGQIEADSVHGGRDSVITPYTRQMSQHPRGEIKPESALEDRNGATTKYTEVAPNQLQDGMDMQRVMEDDRTPHSHQIEDDARGDTGSPLRRSPGPTSVAKKRLMASVEVIMKPPNQSADEALEKNSRQSGAISAPPAVEPGEEKQTKHLDVETPREDFESHPVTPKQRVPSANQSVKSQGHQKPDTPKQAFRTPRSSRSDSTTSALSEESIVIGRDIETDIDEGVAMEIAPSQSNALHSLKNMMVEENLSIEQQKTLDSLRSALKSIASADQKLTNKQLERTVTILSLASQLAHESAELGVVPDSVFNSFASMSSRTVSSLSDSEPLSGAITPEQKGVSDKRLQSVEERRLPKEEQQKEAVFKLVPEKSVKPQKPQREISADKKQREKKLPHDSDRTVSGSMNLEYGSSRGDSFSASIPRTLTSSEWRRMSVHDPFSPEPVKPQTDGLKRTLHSRQGAGHGKEQKATDIAKNGQKPDSRHEISVVISPKKKSRAVVTREEMLYGEGSMHVDPTGEVTAMEILKMEAESIQGSRLSKPNQHHQNTPEQSDTNSDILSARSIPRSTLSGCENIHASPHSSPSPRFKSPVFPKLPPGQVKQSKFKCVSKVLTVELASLKAKQREVSARQSSTGSAADVLNQNKFENESFSVVGTKFNKMAPHQKVNGKQDQSDEQEPDTNLGVSRSKSEIIPKRSPKGSTSKEYLGNLLLSNRNQYDTNSSEFSLKDTLTGQTTMAGLGPQLEASDYQLSTNARNLVSIATQCTENDIMPIGIGHRSQKHTPDCKQSPKHVPDLVSIATQCTGSDISTELGQEVMSEPAIGDFSTDEPLARNSLTSLPKSPQSSRTRSPVSTSQDHKSFTQHNTPVPTSQDHKPSTPHITRASTSKDHKSSTQCHTPVLTRKSLSSHTDSIDIPSSPAPLQKAQSHDPLPPSSPVTAPTPGTNVSEIQRPLSYSSFQPARIPSPVVVVHKETQTDMMMPMIEKEPIKGGTEDEIRASSAKSRASLRNQFKSRLDETRQAAEERRTKSPVISVPSQKSIDDELIIEEDDDDLPIPDDQKAGEFFGKEDTMDDATSPPPGPKLEKQMSVSSRHSINLSEHPVVKEYLRAYTGIHNFKEAISRILEDKDQMSASQILADLDNIPFDKDTKVVPQIESMTENVYYVLNEVSQVVNSVLQNDRGPVVSSLMMGMSRDQTQRTIVREKSGVTADFQPLLTRASQRSQGSKLDSASTERLQYKELQEQYEKLQNQMSDDAKKFEVQQKHNVVVMMEMQDTINQLQRELSNLGKQPRRPLSENLSTAGASQNTESAVMFTRLDSERNAKIMKKAVNEKKLDANRYKEAMVQMDDYVTLPGQRLAHLVRKYVHHCRMKEIEENVQSSNSLNENVFEILDKMEALQNQRAKRWADKMDEMGVERMKLANVLMETFDDIERESGIFLIKPMYSYRGREAKERYSGKISRPFRPQRTLSPLRDVNSAYAPAPTPASNMRPVRVQQAKEAAQLGQPQEQTPGTQHDNNKPLEGDSIGLMGSSVRYIGSQPKTTWNMADSQTRSDQYSQGAGLHGNTPRILELDINRMMIGQNTISASIPGLSNDRLVNASNSNLRSYMTVNRPTGPNSAGKSDRPTSGSRHMDSPGPPPSPTNRSSSTTKRVRMSDIEVPTVLSSTQPLPPIGSSPTPGRTNSGGKGRQSPTRIPVGEVSPSPPGSRGSLRQSPVGMSDTDMSPIK